MTNLATTPNLRRVSITGADDRTDIEELRTLALRYPFVEWALLYAPPAAGKPRNPTVAWRERFFDAKLPGFSAVHLCFKESFEQLLAGELPQDILQADRLQLNINARAKDFSETQVLDVFNRALGLGPQLILQYQPDTAGLIALFWERLNAADKHKVCVLLDESRGRGILPSRWAVPSWVSKAFCGFAGGIGPENIFSVLRTLEGLQRPYWVDMETRMRTANNLDLLKVEQVLAASARIR